MTRSTLKIRLALAALAGLLWTGAAEAQGIGSKLGSTSYQGAGATGFGQQVSVDAARVRKARALANLINSGKCDEALRQVQTLDDAVLSRRVREVCASTVAAANTTTAEAPAKP
jgi:hypothetical protein